MSDEPTCVPGTWTVVKVTLTDIGPMPSVLATVTSSDDAYHALSAACPQWASLPSLWALVTWKLVGLSWLLEMMRLRPGGTLSWPVLVLQGGSEDTIWAIIRAT